MDIVKFLKREKELLLQRLEIAEAGNARLRSNVQKLEGDLEEKRYNYYSNTKFQDCKIIFSRIAYEFLSKNSSSNETVTSKYLQMVESIESISKLKVIIS